LKRIIVIGCPGSGKSTFSKKLHQVTQIPVYHLDMLYWNSDKTTVTKTVFRERLNQVIHQDTWIIDGNYGSTMELRLQACDTVFFLDYPLKVCLDGVKSRRGKERTDLPWVESDENIDEEFIKFIKEYNTVNRPVVIDLLKRYADKDVFILNSRKDADEFLVQLNG
jgi:adenylate kinase family enzyme